MSDELKDRILYLIKQRTPERPISSVDIWEIVKGDLNGQNREQFRGDLRGFINEFRQGGIRILADSRGYWLAQSDEEVFQYIKRLTHRWLEIKKALDGLKRTIPKDRWTEELFKEEIKC